jgi:hypothetical protein
VHLPPVAYFALAGRQLDAAAMPSLRVGTWQTSCRRWPGNAIGIAVKGDRGHRDDRTFGKWPFEADVSFALGRQDMAPHYPSDPNAAAAC